MQTNRLIWLVNTNFFILYFSFMAIFLALVSLSVQANILQNGEDGINKVEAVVKDRQFPNYGTWELWGSWSSCSQTCGSGLQTRFRYCNFDHEEGPSFPGASFPGCKKWYTFITTLYIFINLVQIYFQYKILPCN